MTASIFLALQPVEVGQTHADQCVFRSFHSFLDSFLVLPFSVFVGRLAHFVENEGLGGVGPVELHAHERTLSR